MRKWLPLITISLGTFMLLIDVTIVNVAIPDMVAELHTSFGSLQWVIDAYALALAALLLSAGSVADLVGHRTVYIGGLALFAASSLTCGLAPNSAVLITARTVQGVGAAAMFATTFALLNSSYLGRDRGTAFGMWGAVSGASAAIGPIIGGVLTQLVSWRWIFFVNLPVSVLAIWLCLRVLPAGQARHQSRVDVPGMLSFTGSAGLLTYALIRANERGWADASVRWLLVVAAALLVAFVLVERHSRHAMFDLAMLRNRTFTGILIAGMLLTFAAFSAFTYTSIWLQTVLGLGAIDAGLIGLPMSVAAFAVSASVGRFMHGSRPDLVIGGGLLFIGAGGVLTAALTHGSASWPALIPGFAVIGVGVGLATPTIGSAAMAAVRPERGGMAAGAVNTTRQLGFALGIAALGSVFAASARGSLADDGVPHAAAAARAVAGGQSPVLLAHVPAAAREAAEHAVHAAAVTGVQVCMLVSGVIGLVAGVFTLALMRPSKGSRTGSQQPGAAQVASASKA